MSRCWREGVGREAAHGTVSSGTDSAAVGPPPSSHRPLPDTPTPVSSKPRSPDPTDACGSSPLFRGLRDDSAPERENPVSLFTREKHKQAPLGPEQRGESIGRCESLKPGELAPSRVGPSGTPTRAGERGEILCLAGAGTEAGRTRGTLASGMKHVCSIYTMGFYVFYVSMKPRQRARTRPPCCLLHYERR